MRPDQKKLIERAENAKRESKHLDFKREFDASSSATWCELIKDIVAFANSGGGIIVFGVNNNGSHSGVDVTAVFQLDPADITNRIHGYTNYQFADIEIVTIERTGVQLPAFIVSDAEVPMIFTRPGTYDIGGGKQKNAFAQGTIYFRHGAKSEPGNRDDLMGWRDYTLEKIRRGWLGGIRRVVEAPPGHAVTVVSSPVPPVPGSPPAKGVAITAKVSADSGAIPFVPQNAEEIWPHRQKDLLREVNKQIGSAATINGHDILCINSELNIFKAHPEFAYKPHKLSSPQYSNEFVKWIVDRYKQDKKFFERMRENYRKRTSQK